MNAETPPSDAAPVRPTLTGLVLTYNGERLLERCLDSLAFCDELLVVDSCSTDATERLALARGARLVRHPWQGPLPQFALAFAEVRTDWVLNLDQDECCSAPLRAAIQEALASAPPDVCGFMVRRRSWYYNRFMKHSGWYPDPLLRLFRPGGVEVTQSGAHWHIRPTGRTLALNADILHYPYADFAQHLDKINSYAQEGANDLARRGRRGGVAVAVLHALGRFARLYFLKRGFLDGRAGFINAVHGAFYAFAKYVRIHEGRWGAPYDHS